MSNAQIIEGKWDQVVGHVKKKWGLLTDDDLAQAEGDYDLLVGKIQEKTGKARQEIEDYLAQIAQAEASTLDHVRETAEEYTRRVQEATAYAAENAREQYEQAEQFVRERPGQSVAFMFGVGIAAGLFLGLTLRR